MVVAIFVFGRILRRRREYVVLLAQGLPARRMQLVIIDQTRYAAAGRLVAGLIAGNGLGAADTRLAGHCSSWRRCTARRPIVVLIGLLTLASLRSALSALATLAVGAHAGVRDLVVRRLELA